MTAPRRPRSARLLVGSTPSTSVKVHSAGQLFKRFLAKRRWYFVFVLLRAACSSPALSSRWSGLIRSRRRARAPPSLASAPAATRARSPPEARPQGRPGLARGAVGGDPKGRRAGAQRAPERASLAG